MSNTQYYLSAIFCGMLLFYLLFFEMKDVVSFRKALEFDQLSLSSPEGNWMEEGAESFNQNLAKVRPAIERNTVFKCSNCNGNGRDAYIELENKMHFNFYILRRGEFYVYNTGMYHEEGDFLIFRSDLLFTQEAFFRSKKISFCGTFLDSSDECITNWETESLSEGAFEIWKMEKRNGLIDTKKKIKYELLEISK